jgi:hypothetical protein
VYLEQANEILQKKYITKGLRESYDHNILCLAIEKSFADICPEIPPILSFARD